MPKLDAIKVAEVIIAEFAPRRAEPADQVRGALEQRIEAEVAAYVARYRARGLSERRMAVFENVVRHHTRRALERPKPLRWATTGVGTARLGPVRRG